MTDGPVRLRYVYPNGFSPLIVQCTFVVAFAIINEAYLSPSSALGLILRSPPGGTCCATGNGCCRAPWWLALFLGIALVLAVLTLNPLGDALRDALDPRARSR
jgi:peptide/nickel transport system permease protein